MRIFVLMKFGEGKYYMSSVMKLWLLNQKENLLTIILHSKGGTINILEWLYTLPTVDAFYRAVQKNRLNVFQWLYKKGWRPKQNGIELAIDHPIIYNWMAKHII